jgi:hypothetical protein
LRLEKPTPSLRPLKLPDLFDVAEELNNIKFN